MTLLSTHPVDEPDLLALIADAHTVTRKSFADLFRAACKAEADAHDGWIDPNRVRRRLIDEPEYNPRQLSALWSASCGSSGFMVKTTRPVRIQADGSKGNGNKSTFWRRWVG